MRCNMFFFIIWCHWCWYQCNMDADGVSNGTIAFVRSTMMKMKCNMTFLVIDTIGIIDCTTWYQQYFLVVLLHSLGQDDWHEEQHDFLVMWHHLCWHWHFMMPSALSVVLLHSLGQDDQHEVQRDILVISPNNIVYMQTPHYCTIHVKNCNFYFPYYNHICANNKICPSDAIHISDASPSSCTDIRLWDYYAST